MISRIIKMALLILLTATACEDDGNMPPEGIVYFQIGIVIDNDTPEGDQYFDLNNDGYNDLRLRYDCNSPEHAIELLADCDEEFHFPEGRVSMFLDMHFDTPNQLAIIDRYEAFDRIDESLGIDGGCGHLAYRSDDMGTAELGEFPLGSEGYIAMQIRNPDGLYHFGWLRVRTQDDCSGIEFVDGAYEIRQGKAILAGQMSY